MILNYSAILFYKIKPHCTTLRHSFVGNFLFILKYEIVIISLILLKVVFMKSVLEFSRNCVTTSQHSVSRWLDSPECDEVACKI